MESLIGDMFFAIAGWLYLLVKHRNFDKMRELVAKKYENRYALAGRDLILTSMLIVFAIMIFALMFISLYAAFKS